MGVVSLLLSGVTVAEYQPLGRVAMRMSVLLTISLCKLCLPTKIILCVHLLGVTVLCGDGTLRPRHMMVAAVVGYQSSLVPGQDKMNGSRCTIGNLHETFGGSRVYLRVSGEFPWTHMRL